MPARGRAAFRPAVPRTQIVMFLGAEFVAVYTTTLLCPNHRHQASVSPSDALPRKAGRIVVRPSSCCCSACSKRAKPFPRRTASSTSSVTAIRTAFFDISYSPIRDEDGIVHGVLCIVRETTERLRVAEIDARSAAIVDSSDDAIISKDLDSKT